MKGTTLGIDQLSRLKTKKKVGLLCHPASASRQLEHLMTIADRRIKVVSVFGPQHGIHGETQDNMIEWQDSKDRKGRPIYSLYGEHRQPTDASLAEVELMIVDLFDVGARYYTFIYTLAYMMEACARKNIPVLICDRPNPLGGDWVEGSILNPSFRSFVGLYEIPVCHGMTIGELALWMGARMSPQPQIQILKMKSWNRRMRWPDTKLIWTLPSPNMPSYETAVVYPGMCLLEGTTLSEGRGTTRPFELIGAPFFVWDEIEKEYRQIARNLKLSPIVFHRQGFIPTFHKFAGETCMGALQIIPEPRRFRPLIHAVSLLWIFRKLYGQQWQWKNPPYEYEYIKLPIDILCGNSDIRECIDSQGSLKRLRESWVEDEHLFKKERRPYLLYR